MSKANKKSTGTQPQVVYVALPKLPQVPKQSRSAVKNSKVMRNNKKDHSVEYLSTQPKSKKSTNGSSFNDGFDCRNAPYKPKVRYEDFDEFCYTLNGSQAYTQSSIALNPAQPLVFPRLNNFAKLYDRYKFTKLEVYFQHDVSQYADQGSTGLVVMSCLYDAAAPGPTGKAQQEMTNPHVIGMPNQNILLKLDPSRLHPSGYPLFTRPGIKPGGTDIKTYDAGVVFVGTQGMALNNTEVGEIHVRGTVAFYDEVIDTSHNLPGNQQNYSEFETSAGQNVTSSAEAYINFDQTDTNGLQVVRTVSNTVFTPPAGEYLIQAWTNTTFTGLGYDSRLRIFRNGSPVSIYSETSMPSISASIIRCDNRVSQYERTDGTNTYWVGLTTMFGTGSCSTFGQISFLAL